jgi:dTDP-4-dehydrorhamnose 3,5-epimerase
MIFHKTRIDGVFFVRLETHGDARGYLKRTFCKREFSQMGFSAEFVQMNHTFTKHIGTVRGFHFQHPPLAEAKLIRCIRGAVFDVALDLRKGSKTFLQWISVELSAENNTMILIPEGCAHGFQSLADDCEMLYNHTAYYEPSLEAGVRIDDPRINTQWPLPIQHQSERDKSFTLISEHYKGLTL